MYKPEIVFTGKDIARTISDARGITRKQAGEYVDSVFEAMKKELEYIKNTTEKQMYINDLNDLRKEIEKDFK